MRVLLTGASGFLGRAVQERLLNDGVYQVRSVFRTIPENVPGNVAVQVVREIGPRTDWRAALDDVSIVVHCAARVHVMDERERDPLAAFRRVNTEGTVRLATQAAEAGVRRFVFISSIKVNGEFTPPGTAFTASDKAAPIDPYGLSKLEAEQALRALSEVSGMEIVVIRPTLVYGPGVKANFLNMMRWLDKGIPLPLGAIANKRSLVALDNLVDLIRTCMEHSAAANQTFLVSDGEDLSTSELLRRMGQALGKSARLIPVPARVLEFAAALIGKQAISMRLCASLQVDISKTCELLGWRPPVSVDEALFKVARHFKGREGK
jgi:UDP-glucose 4-epimerase